VTRSRLLAAMLAVTSIGLSGCLGGLLGGGDPAQLYRFGGPQAAQAAAATSGARVAVTLAPIDFPQAAGGDRILTVTGNEAAFVKEARWVSPAETLFAESLERTFETRSQAVRLLSRGEAGASTLTLDVDVNAFETRYEGGAPTVLIDMDARLVRYPERTVVAERRISAAQPAGENRMTSIVAAYDSALDSALGQLVTWTDQNAR